MARDKRGQTEEPTVEQALDEIAEENSGEFVAGPTSRNEVGNTKRAAEKATGTMGASTKIDPDLSMSEIDAGRPRSGSPAGVRGFDEVPPEKGAGPVRLEIANEEIVESTTRTARTAPAPRAARTESGGPVDTDRETGARGRVPAPGNVVDVPKGTLVRGHPTATQSGGRSQSSTGDEKPPKRAARAGKTNQRPLSKGGSEERD
ncbi:hypothetical protein [Microvirga massiliensis]|uniref:hypothetical protein n=1 Tax=Microvirga massiliensis TaxID=1033741 RepID=UPI00062B3268|nr:hypothetical protein [Microvirga massiliensis]